MLLHPVVNGCYALYVNRSLIVWLECKVYLLDNQICRAKILSGCGVGTGCLAVFSLYMASSDVNDADKLAIFDGL